MNRRTKAHAAAMNMAARQRAVRPVRRAPKAHRPTKAAQNRPGARARSPEERSSVSRAREAETAAANRRLVARDAVFIESEA